MTRLANDLHLAQILARPGYGVREGRVVNTNTPTPDAPTTVSTRKPPGTAAQSGDHPTSGSAGSTSQEDQAGKPRATGAALTLPWPPSGNHSHGHFDNQRFLRAEVIAYRDTVEHLCAGKGCIAEGRYRIHVHFSPPDARERDMDNALKQLFDALKRCYLHSDSMVYMRELLVTTDDDRLNHVRVRAVAI